MQDFGDSRDYVLYYEDEYVSLRNLDSDVKVVQLPRGIWEYVSHAFLHDANRRLKAAELPPGAYGNSTHRTTEVCYLSRYYGEHLALLMWAAEDAPDIDALNNVINRWVGTEPEHRAYFFNNTWNTGKFFYEDETGWRIAIRSIFQTTYERK